MDHPVYDVWVIDCLGKDPEEEAPPPAEDTPANAALPDEVQPLVGELNLLFERVQRAFEAQQHFVADAAHELRSPLTALRLQMQALQRAADDQPSA